MNCPKCGNQVNDNAKFCRKCGEPLDGPVKHNLVKKDQESFFARNRLLLLVIAIIVVIGVCVGIFILNSNVEMETHNFGSFSMSVPKGSDFILDSSSDFENIGGFYIYENVGNYARDANLIGVHSLSLSNPPSSFLVTGSDGDIRIFQSSEDNNLYYLTRTVGNYEFYVMGYNLNVLKDMLRSVQVTGVITNDTSPVPTTTSSVPSSSGSLSILSGSFSTGSGLSDKTYCTIYVGAQHAGESCYVQIFYSRDGSSLNNGNMVPVTVDSSGYISVSSADAYSVFPDHATIKLYDSNQNLQDTRDVQLSPTSGTQTF